MTPIGKIKKFKPKVVAKKKIFFEELKIFELKNQEEETLTEQEIVEIQEALENVKKGNVISLEALAKELGVKLH